LGTIFFLKFPFLAIHGRRRIIPGAINPPQPIAEAKEKEDSRPDAYSDIPEYRKKYSGSEKQLLAP
jgi:hypothetical protein